MAKRCKSQVLWIWLIHTSLFTVRDQISSMCEVMNSVWNSTDTLLYSICVQCPGALTIFGAGSVACICCTWLSTQEHPYSVDRAHRGSLILPSTIKIITETWWKCYYNNVATWLWQRKYSIISNAADKSRKVQLLEQQKNLKCLHTVTCTVAPYLSFLKAVVFWCFWPRDRDTLPFWELILFSNF